jgi:cation-transporting P-type ATPase F
MLIARDSRRFSRPNSKPASAPGQSHHIATEEVVALLGTNLDSGLTTPEAKARLGKFGPNQLSSPQHSSALRRFLQQFAQPLMYILLIAAAVTVFLGEYVDSAVIAGVVFINAIAGFLQEAKAERAIEALTRMIRTEATVRRDGSKARINSVELVPGDIVLLQSGDRVPADLRLFRVRNLQVDEAASRENRSPCRSTPTLWHWIRFSRSERISLSPELS